MIIRLGGNVSFFVPKWSRLLEVILGRFEHRTFGFIWSDLFPFLPTQTIIETQEDFIYLIAPFPAFTYFFFFFNFNQL